MLLPCGAYSQLEIKLLHKYLTNRPSRAATTRVLAGWQSKVSSKDTKQKPSEVDLNSKRMVCFGCEFGLSTIPSGLSVFTNKRADGNYLAGHRQDQLRQST